MVIFAALSTISGIVLGMRFRVFVLFPAIALVCMAVAGIDASVQNSPWSAAITVVVSATALQIGYFAGILLRAAQTGRTFVLHGNTVP